MKKIILLSAIALFVIMGCKPIDYEFNYLGYVVLCYKDSGGEAILKKGSKIQIYYYVNGEMLESEKVIPSNLTSRKSYVLIEKGDSIKMRVCPYSESFRKNQAIYVKLENYSLDTITYEYSRTKRQQKLEKVWVNNKLIPKEYYNYHNEDTPITIIK